MTDARTAPGLQRLAALVLLLAAGILSLPLAAAAFDGEGTENFILPAQLGGMALLGALVGYLLPGLAGDSASTRRAVWVGVGVALLLAVLGVVFFFLLLNGFDGAWPDTYALELSAARSSAFHWRNPSSVRPRRQ